MSILIRATNEPKFTVNLRSVKKTVTSNSKTKLIQACSKSYKYYFYRDESVKADILVREPRRKSNRLTACEILRTNFDFTDCKMIVFKGYIYFVYLTQITDGYSKISVRRVRVDKRYDKITRVHDSYCYGDGLLDIKVIENSIVVVIKNNNNGFTLIGRHYEIPLVDQGYIGFDKYNRILSYSSNYLHRISLQSLARQDIKIPFNIDRCVYTENVIYCKVQDRWYKLWIVNPV